VVKLLVLLLLLPELALACLHCQIALQLQQLLVLQARAATLRCSTCQI
jgi:hypothetical protein